MHTIDRHAERQQSFNFYDHETYRKRERKKDHHTQVWNKIGRIQFNKILSGDEERPLMRETWTYFFEQIEKKNPLRSNTKSNQQQKKQQQKIERQIDSRNFVRFFFASLMHKRRLLCVMTKFGSVIVFLRESIHWPMMILMILVRVVCQFFPVHFLYDACACDVLVNFI